MGNPRGEIESQVRANKKFFSLKSWLIGGKDHTKKKKNKKKNASIAFPESVHIHLNSRDSYKSTDK